mmetsp:Transcript_36830/g.91695  ORF Transcript_36830/g.91695 Transcript_36830/m.91695 type:complete len:228 (+) Transcript_36830:365-1048(+)
MPPISVNHRPVMLRNTPVSSLLLDLGGRLGDGPEVGGLELEPRPLSLPVGKVGLVRAPGGVQRCVCGREVVIDHLVDRVARLLGGEPAVPLALSGVGGPEREPLAAVRLGRLARALAADCGRLLQLRAERGHLAPEPRELSLRVRAAHPAEGGELQRQLPRALGGECAPRLGSPELALSESSSAGLARELPRRLFGVAGRSLSRRRGSRGLVLGHEQLRARVGELDL